MSMTLHGGHMKKDRWQEEIKLIGFMIDIYSKGNPHADFDTEALKEYAVERIQKCPYIETKTFCSSCKTHCYKAQQREQIRRIMRYAGPRMLLYHPILACKHVVDSIKNKKRNK